MHNIIKKGEIYQEPKSLVVWVGGPGFSFLFGSCEVDGGRGDLSGGVDGGKSFAS